MPIDAVNIARLVNGWTGHFWNPDHEIQWLAAEQEMSLSLDPHTLLLGKVDAIGRTPSGELFFGEWKTANPRERTTWKQVWRMNPQSLTYGVLASHHWPGCRRFTVRKAFKSEPPAYDHAWFSYSEAELEHWRGELCRVATEIRVYRKQSTENWPVNHQNCFRYGIKNACEFFEPACSQLDFAAKPNGALVRISHLDSERRLNASDPELVVLDATRVKMWLECRERYRRTYEENVAVPVAEGSALDIGTTFHEMIGHHYTSLI